MLKKEQKNVDVGKNDDTGETRKSYPSNPFIWIYHFLNLQRQDGGSYYFVVFLDYPRLFIESESIFIVQKNISILVTLPTVCQKGIWNLDLAGCRIFWSWIETEPLNKSITAPPYQWAQLNCDLMNFIH